MLRLSPNIENGQYLQAFPSPEIQQSDFILDDKKIAFEKRG